MNTFKNLVTTLRNQNSMKKFHENNTINCVLTEFIAFLIGHDVVAPAAKVTQ